MKIWQTNVKTDIKGTVGEVDWNEDNLLNSSEITPIEPINLDAYTTMLSAIQYIKVDGKNLRLDPTNIINLATKTNKIESIENQTVKFFDASNKEIAEMTPKHCILHQPLNPKVLEAVQNCYGSVIVTRCGSLKAAMELRAKMPGVKFSDQALKMIEERFNRDPNPTAKDRNDLEELKESNKAKSSVRPH